MLIGRVSERRVIEQLIAGARVGSSGVLVITGEPGIGKTALVDEAAALAAGMRLLRARGSEAEREVPFGGLLQLLRPALDQLDRIPPPQRDALGAALALSEPAAGDRFAVGAATLSLVCRYAEPAPVALLVDDVHLLDRPSAEALLFVARRLLADPIVLIAAARTGEPTPLAGAHLPALELDGVDLGTAQQLVGSRADRVVPADLVTRLYRTVAGNPLALLELSGDLERLGKLPPGAPLPVPAVLAEGYAARARRLGPQARTALLAAAAEGGDLGVVAQTCGGLGVDVAALAEAERAALVTLVDGRVEFRHPLVRSAVYSGADPAERRAVHRAVAAALPERDDRRTWHLSEAVLGTDPEIATALAGVATRAAERGAYAVAATGYERSARLTPGAGRRAERLAGAGEAAWTAGLPDRAASLLTEALALDPPGPVRTRLQAVRGDIEVRCGSPARARDVLTEAAAQAAAADPAAAAEMYADAVYACFFLGDVASAQRSGDAIEELLPRLTDPGTRSLGLVARGVALVLAGRGGTDQLRDAVRLLSASDAVPRDTRRLDWMVIGPLFLRESGTGRSLVDQATRHSRDRGALSMLPALLFHLARYDATTDRWADAESSYDEAIRLSRETGQTTELGIALAGLAWLHAHQGRAGDCRRRAAEAVRICREHQIHLGHAWALFALGDLELGRGAVAEAIPLYEELAALLETMGVLDADLSPAPELVDVYCRLGRSQEAAGAAREFAARADGKGRPWSLARASRAAGLVGPDDRLDEHFGAALAAHQQTLDVFQTARTRLAYGARLRRARRRVDARTQLRQAVDAFDRLGATGWADLAAAELKATGETARRREPSTAADLTPQERQIALLLADGLSTREAAAAMFLSPKTIEYHLRNVYTKLGIHSRAELAELMKE